MNQRDKRLYRDTEQQKIAGVSAGIARYVDVDPLIVRVLFVASIPLGGFGVIVYLAAWLVMTPAPDGYWVDDEAEQPGRRIYKDPDDKKLAGVCGGIAKAYDIDPAIVRLAFVVFVFFGGAGILAYLTLAVLLDDPPAGAGAEAAEVDGGGDEDDAVDDDASAPEADDVDGD